MFVLLSADVPETLLVFVQIDQRVFTCYRTFPQNEAINTTTSGSESK